MTAEPFNRNQGIGWAGLRSDEGKDVIAWENRHFSREWIRRMNIGVVFVTEDLMVTVYNEIARDLLDANIPLGETTRLEDCLPSTREEFRLFAQISHTHQEVRDAVVTWETSGRLRHVLVDSYKDVDENACMGMYILMKDLSNFSAMEQHMQRSDKLATVGKIAAGIAHEIRNPLTTIKGFLQVMEQGLNEKQMDAEVRKINVMLSEINRVNSLVSELLLLSKPHEVEKMSYSVETLFHEINPLIESEALLRGIDYVCALDPVPSVVIAPALIKQLVLNLVKNAFEAMENSGQLKIQVGTFEDSVRIDISDTGPGIPYYQMDKIFDAFYTTKEKGTGLGLPICQRIVADHHGDLRVSSKGFGTTLSVFLPITQESAN